MRSTGMTVSSFAGPSAIQADRAAARGLYGGIETHNHRRSSCARSTASPFSATSAPSRPSARVTKLSIATNRSWTSASDGERKERTDWVPVTVLDERQAEWIAANITKGDAVYIEARVGETSYDKDGERRYTVDVIADMVNLVKSRPED